MEPADERLQKAFQFSVDNGGLLELDFTREPGVSYNPRPARVGLILLNDVRSRSLDQIIAGFFATSASDASALFTEPSFADPIRMASLALAAPESLLQADTLVERAARDLALALHLDRARHRHQAPNAKSGAAWEQFLADTAAYVALAKESEHPLFQMLDHWYRRASHSRTRES
ncbi:MAG: hypothetical protein U0136_14275 [Bdellovibrionota bacterium]